VTTPSPAFLVVFAALAVLASGLSLWVIYLRNHLRVGIGDGGHGVLKRAIRVHANFTEWVPITAIALLVADLSGTAPQAVAALGGTLVLARGLHASGLGRRAGTSPGRFLGTLLTQGVLLTSAGLALWNAMA